jgi:galactokinase
MPRRNDDDAIPNDDFTAHAKRLRGLTGHAHSRLSHLFVDDEPVLIARAPGRLDLMGGIADYSGSLVLEMPIAEAAFAAVQTSEEPGVRIASLPSSESGSTRCVDLSANEWTELATSNYRLVRDALRRRDDNHWVAYVLGAVLVLLRETHTAPPVGLRILIDSQVPEGKGVSSSAAIEVATMRAAAALLNLDLSGEELARLCQLAENQIAGAPCGIMDQMTSALGRAGELLSLRCQPSIVEGFVPLPAEIGVWGIDSGIRHAVSGSDYSSVRCGAFMGYRIIAAAKGLRVTSAAFDAPLIGIDDPHWYGYLANISPSVFREQFEHVLPESMTGADFIAHYVGTTDRVTRIDPSRTYAVRAPTKHPIEENARVERFRSLLQSPITEQSLAELGQLMYASHASYSACGLGNDGTDQLVELVRTAGADSGLYGAKSTGGGSGGTVAVLGRADAERAVDRVARKYTEATGRDAYIFRGSSPGAFATPVAKIVL